MRNIFKSSLVVVLIALLLTGCFSPSIEQNSTSQASTTQTVSTLASSSTVETTMASTSSKESSDSTIQSSTTSTPVKLDGILKAHFIDVGQADCIYIELPNSENMLIDAGNNADKDTILNYLNSLGVKKLDYVIATHPHEDHIGSLDSVINSFDIGNIYMPKVTTNTKTFEDVLTAIQNKGLKITSPESGSYLINIRYPIDKNTVKDELVVQFIAPNSTKYDDLNNYSIVVKITFKNTTFLLMGDAEDVSESEILSTGYNVEANLIKIGHHGSSNSTTAGFLEDVQPQYAVISVGKGNDYGHPAQSTIDRLNAAGVKIFRTDEQGTITATSDGETIKIDKSASPVKEQAPPKPAVSQNSSTSKTQDITVYITNSGKKYHLDGCRYLAKSKIPIKLSEAKAEGYTPCSVCNPPK